MKMEHERKWKVPFGLVELPLFDLHIIGDAYLASPTEPVLRMRKMMSFTDSEPRPRGWGTDPARAWSRAQPRPEEGNVHLLWALGKVEHGLLEVTLKRGSGVSRQELTWRGGGVNLVRPQGLKIRRAVALPQGVLSVDRYLTPEILIFEILELEGELEAVKAYEPPPEWRAEEVTGVAEYSNRALLRGGHGRS